MSDRLLVVIVNYRTGALAADCLRSLRPEAESIPGFSAVVVDNASGDGSVAVLKDAIEREGFGSWARVMPLEKNLGFAAGNNAAVRDSLQSADPPAWFFFLNPDTYARAGAVSELLGFMRAHPAVGIAGARSEDPDGTPQVSCFRFNTVTSELLLGFRLSLLGRLFPKREVFQAFRDETREVEWVSGAAMMVRREVIDTIGCMDDGYFLYFEEQDFCLRARRAGFSCWFVPTSRIVHLLGRSTGVTGPEAARRRLPGYWFEARRRYFLKNWGPFRTAAADLFRLIGHASWRLRRAIQHIPDRDPQRFLSDLFRHSIVVKGFRL